MNIELTRGKYAIIDDDDWEIVKLCSSWRAAFTHKVWYAIGYRHRSQMAMHTLLMEPPKGMVVHHVNGNGLDNRRENLKICTHVENRRAANRVLAPNNRSGFRGVCWDTERGKWTAHIRYAPYKSMKLGRFDSAEEAAREYDKAARLAHGEFATLNFEEESL